MTYFDYFLTNDDENQNMSWCKPFVDSNEEYFLIIHDGEVESAVTPEGTYYRYDGTLTDEIMERIARAVNEYYDDYSGYTDCDIALEAMTETGCLKCPGRDECEALGENFEGIHGQGWHVAYRFPGFIRDWQKINALVEASGEEPLFASEDEYKTALNDGTIRYLYGWTTIWSDGIY